MKVCSFCKENKPLTREHLWPASLHKRLYKVNELDRKYFWLEKNDKTIASEPKIKDVCADCNNGALSQLDTYICELFDQSFVHMPEKGESVVFKHDHNKLKRWLLKMSYNSARISNSPDLFALEVLIPYIMGTDDSLGGSVQLFLQLAYPQEVPPESNPDSIDNNPDSIDKLYPDIHRSGFVFFKVKGEGQKVLRAIHLRSYSFIISYWPPGSSLWEQYDFASYYLNAYPTAIWLTENTTSVEIECGAVGAYDSIKQSRTTKLEFE
ncbi:hypothetical protein WOB98_22225 [Vibrio parahaemolyticus]|uniref:hypothetical protein n=1 Tax=Vibrio parahaemolyticus TaxID=670 RepID=UPI0009444DB5|nr:hypothetical protein [Vibrio parahaemolyticus]OKY28132.1 hypothetical protein BTU71_24735 [Vibrio parahaemolyticus]HCG9621043.1 hypothetical protein [Vibrio parahaemolyticus]HCM1391652.1 hypothetical protein [Vibrio parahaemolyticus]